MAADREAELRPPGTGQWLPVPEAGPAQMEQAWPLEEAAEDKQRALEEEAPEVVALRRRWFWTRRRCLLARVRVDKGKCPWSRRCRPCIQLLARMELREVPGELVCRLALVELAAPGQAAVGEGQRLEGHIRWGP